MQAGGAGASHNAYLHIDSLTFDDAIVLLTVFKMVDFLIGHYTYRIFPPAIDIIPTLLAVVYSNKKYTN